MYIIAYLSFHFHGYFETTNKWSKGFLEGVNFLQITICYDWVVFFVEMGFSEVFRNIIFKSSYLYIWASLFI